MARENGAPKPSSETFPLLGDALAPFKVFSHPPEIVFVSSKPGGVTYTDEYEASHNVPFGGRFGQFDVMTPIAERTLEDNSTDCFSIPDRDVSAPEEQATVRESNDIVPAERLAAEVRRDTVFVSEHKRNTRSDEATSASSSDLPFRLSDVEKT